MDNLYMLPEDFVEQMQLLLGKEFEEFEKSYDKVRFAGLRFNPLKTDIESFMSVMTIN